MEQEQGNTSTDTTNSTPKSIWQTTVALCQMVKIEHSIFALPFAYMGAFLAAKGWPGLYSFLFLTLAMVAIRSFAMAFNRIADFSIDRKNPRTQNRPLVTGAITMKQAWIFCAIMVAIFMFSCWMLNSLCFYLAPVALFFSAFYSYTKRFTWAAHFFLGAVLALSPLAGWFAVLPEFSMTPILFAFSVLFWCAGFDMLYSCLDRDFDIENGLHSVPVRFGIQGALNLAALCHVNTVIFSLLAGWSAGLSWPWYLAWAIVCALLFFEHRLNSPEDLSRVNTAFFVVNGVVAVIFLGGVLAGIYI